MSKNLCAWDNCTNERDTTRTYRNCNGCGKTVGPVNWNYCYDHRTGISETTGCRYMIPWNWSCYKCYSQDFDDWIPDPEHFPVDEWSQALEQYKQKLP